MKTLQEKLNYTFQDKNLLRLALTHPSTKQPDNQRLEFLGDAILEFCVSTMLYQQFPKCKEGELTAKRAFLVCEKTLATIAQSLSVGNALVLGHGEALTGGREKPAILADAMEAIFAAVYLDAGITVVQSLIHRLFSQVNTHACVLDDKSALQEWTQANGLALPTYSIINSEGPDHNRTFTAQVYVMEKPIATGVGLSKKSAEQSAAKTALTNYKIGKEL